MTGRQDPSERAGDEMKAAEASKLKRRALDQRIMSLFGTEWCGNDNPPKDHRTLYVHDDGVIRVFATTNDGFEVGIGYPDEWHVIMRERAARMFAWWVIKNWIADWFGLRSHIYYVALHHRVSGRWKLRPHRHKRTVWPSSYEEWRRDHAGR